MGCDQRKTVTIRLLICFNSRTPCGVRRDWGVHNASLCEFQFTHPVWGATELRAHILPRLGVSIHAPRVGCDSVLVVSLSWSLSFNSRTPCGVRPTSFAHDLAPNTFQFTHPVWGATKCSIIVRQSTEVSIHAPRVGCDADARTDKQFKQMFQFTHPVWGATISHSSKCNVLTVSIHAPRVGCDYLCTSY